MPTFAKVTIIETTPFTRLQKTYRKVPALTAAAGQDAYVNVELILALAWDVEAQATRILLAGHDEGHFIAMSVLEPPLDIISATPVVPGG